MDASVGPLEAVAVGTDQAVELRVGPKAAKLARNDALREYVQDRLAGTVSTRAGVAVPGPQVRRIGRRHGPRKDRRWATSWSPKQIANRLSVDFPDDASMRVSHEAIYQALYIQGRGALRRELTACLRTGFSLRNETTIVADRRTRAASALNPSRRAMSSRWLRPAADWRGGRSRVEYTLTRGLGRLRVVAVDSGGAVRGLAEPLDCVRVQCPVASPCPSRARLLPRSA
jgi:hypothetical protein